MKPRHALMAALTLACCAAGAQTLKPGLWEISNKMQSGSGQMEQAMSQMQQQLASMPPEQRKMVQDMMARKGAAAGPGDTAVKVCMTQDMVERNELPTQRGDCKTSASPRQGNIVKLAFACSNPPSSGEGQVTITSPEAYAMKMTVKTVVQGKPEQISLDGGGKWLSADCGAVQPLTAPKKN